MSGVPWGPLGPGLFARRDRLRGLWTRAGRHDHRRRSGVAGLRLRAARVSGAGRAAEHDHGPRQRPVDVDRLAEQGRVRPADPAQVAGPDLPPTEVAAPDPHVEERRAVPRPGPDGDQHDGLQDGAPAACPRERRGPVPPGGVAAATIYIAAILSAKPCTQKEVAEVAGVTEVTIRNRYKRISVAIGMVK